MNEKISIIVPVYNAEKYLEKCLDSLINQTYENIEIICVNDGSPDGSLYILNEYTKKDSRVIVIDKKNEGVSEARNTGLKVAGGEYVMFLDSDDWIDVDTCLMAMENMKKHNVDVVMWSYIREYSNRSVEKVIYSQDILFETEKDIKNLHMSFAGPVAEMLKNPENADALSTVWGKLYKKNVIKNIKFIDLKEIGSHEDGLFNLYAFKNVKRALFLNRCFHHYRKDNVTSLTSKYNDKLYERRQRIYKYIIDFIKANNYDEEFIQALYNRISYEIFYLGLNEVHSPGNGKKRRKAIRNIIESEQYRTACKNFSISYFPIHWKIFFACAKCKFVFGLYWMLVIMQKLRSN